MVKKQDVEFEAPVVLGTVNVLAKLMNLTPRRVQQLAKKGIIEKDERGKYDIVRSLAMYVAHLDQWRSSVEIPCSSQDLCHYFGLTRGQIAYLIRQGAIPAPRSHGHFDLAASIRGFVSFVHSRGFVKFYGQACFTFSDKKNGL